VRFRRFPEAENSPGNPGKSPVQEVYGKKSSKEAVAIKTIGKGETRARKKSRKERAATKTKKHSTTDKDC